MTLAHEISGDGPDLLLVHAGVADRRMWAPLIALLGDRFRITRCDLPGFGDSAPRGGLDCEHLAALLDELGVEQTVVCGASYGGRVALELAATHPERVSRLVLLAAGVPGHNWSPRPREFFAAEEAAWEAGRLDEAVELNVELWAGTASEDVQALVRVMQRRAFDLDDGTEGDELDPPVTERLSAVTMPVTVAYGDRDLEDFTAIAQHLAAALPSATLHRIEGAGHLIALEQPEAVAELLLS